MGAPCPFSEGRARPRGARRGGTRAPGVARGASYRDCRAEKGVRLTRWTTTTAIASPVRALASVLASFAVLATIIWGPSTEAAVPERVSVVSGGGQAGDESGSPSLSADGRYVAFVSAANLVSGDTNGLYDVFVYDRESGTTKRVSVATGGTQANGESRSPVISGDGRYVAFLSRATNLVSADTNGRWDVFVHTLATGATERVSVSTGGSPADGDCTRVSLDADGSAVCFTSRATNLVGGDTNGVADVFVRDRVAATTERVSVAGDQSQAGRASDYISVSGDGRWVAFDSIADNLIADDTNGRWDVFVRDLQTGSTARASVDSAEIQASGDSICPSISADGRYVAFESVARDLVAGDTGGHWDVFVRDLTAGTTERVSVTTGGAQGDAGSDSASVSGDGRYVAFVSQATNLIAGDTNGMGDVFVRDRTQSTTARSSMSATGGQGSDDSDSPSMSAGGSHVTFESWAGDLVGSDSNKCADVFVMQVAGATTTPTPPAATTRYQEWDSRLSYAGLWTPVIGSVYSGWGLDYAASAGAAVNVSFTGTRMAWIAKTGPQYGKALVTVDGGQAVTVDLYSPAAGYKKSVFDTGVVADGEHKVSISWTGTKNTRSTGTFISIDAVDIAGTLTDAPLPSPVTVNYQQTDARLTYRGAWSLSSSTSASGGSFSYAGRWGSSVTACFQGTSISVYAKTGPQYGIAKISLDGGAKQRVDFYNSYTRYQKQVYSASGLAPGAHTLTIEWTGEKRAAATASYISVDAVQVVGVLTRAPKPVRYQQNDSHLVYSGPWATGYVSAASAGSLASLNSTGSVTVRWTGTSFCLVTKTAPYYGIAKLTLDGGAAWYVDLYSRTTVYQQRLNVTALLPYGEHTLVIERSGTKNRASSGYIIGIDAIDLVGTLK